MSRIPKKRSSPAEDDNLRIVTAFVEHKRKLAAYLARFMLRPEDIEDILQEAITKTLEISQHKSINSPKSYLFITARNLLRNQVKKQSSHIMKEIGALEGRIDNGEATAFQRMHDKQQLAAFISASNTLPPQCKRVFWLRKIHGKTHKQISRELNISTRTVERHITNAIKHCRNSMESDGLGVDYLTSVGGQNRQKELDHDS